MSAAEVCPGCETRPTVRRHGCGTFTDHPRVPGRQIVCTRHDAGMHVAEAIAPNGPPTVAHRWPL